MSWLVDDWQTSVALLLVAIAIVVLLRKGLATLRRTGSGGGCGSCSNCPTSPSDNGVKKTELFQLGSDPPRTKTGRD